MMAGETTTTDDTPNTESVTVSRTVAHPLRSVWEVLIATQGASALLGEGGELGNKGDGWQAADGSHGVTRSFHPQEQIRFSWHADENAPATLVDLHMRAVDATTTELEIVHDHLPADADRQWLTQHWEAALSSIDDGAL